MTIQEIAELVAGDLTGDGSIEITGISSLDKANAGELAFLAADTSINSQASCVLVPREFTQLTSQPIIRVDDPKLAFAIAASRVVPKREDTRGIEATSIIDPSADVAADWIGAYAIIGANSRIADGSRIYEGVRIGRNVDIGKECTIYPNSVIYDNVSIGDRCVIHAGAVIGADGFGYVRDPSGKYHQFPQIGSTVIEDDVEIGALTCVDRGALGETRIGAGTKIDNLVQIAHNVRIGKRVVIAAQTGISGSTIIEDDCVIGGQVGMGDHAKVLSGAIIGSQAGVLPGKIVRKGVWWGTPVQPLENYKRQNAHIKSLSKMKDALRQLREEIDLLKSSLSDKDPS